MTHKKRGAVINIAPTRAFMSEASIEAYSTSKGGIAALAHACLYIAEQAGFMTGQNLVIDGGMTGKMIYED